MSKMTAACLTLCATGIFATAAAGLYEQAQTTASPAAATASPTANPVTTTTARSTTTTSTTSTTASTPALDVTPTPRTPAPTDIGTPLVIESPSSSVADDTSTSSTVPPATTTSTEPTTTTTLPVADRVLVVAQSQVGQSGPYTVGGYWCAKFVSWVAAQAAVTGFKAELYPGQLHADAVSDGRITTTPAPGEMVFIDLFGPGGAGHGQVTHVGIVESVGSDGSLVTIEGNADSSGVVERLTTRKPGDGYVLDFATFAV